MKEPRQRTPLPGDSSGGEAEHKAAPDVIANAAFQKRCFLIIMRTHLHQRGAASNVRFPPNFGHLTRTGGTLKTGLAAIAPILPKAEFLDTTLSAAVPTACTNPPNPSFSRNCRRAQIANWIGHLSQLVPCASSGLPSCIVGFSNHPPLGRATPAW